MVKHPQTRAERLRLKKIKYNAKIKEDNHSKVRLAKELLKAKEYEDELRRSLGNDSDGFGAASN